MRRYFITGLVLLLPFTITIWIILFIVRLFTKPFLGITAELLNRLPLTNYLPSFFFTPKAISFFTHFAALALLFLLTIVIGYLAHVLFLKSLLTITEKLLDRIPVFNKIYKTCRDIFTTLFIEEKTAFRQVVLVPFPSPDCYSIGLISSKTPKRFKEALKEQELLTVFVPTAPNPTNGFLILLSKEKMIFLDMKTEEALKYVISCGLIAPEDTK